MLKSLRRIIDEVEDAVDFSTALSSLVRSVRESLETEACSIFLIDYRTQDYILSATDGLNAALVGKLHIKLDLGLLSIIGDTEQPLNLEDAPTHPNYLHIPGSGEEIYHAFLGVPIIYNRHVLGIIVAEQRERRRFAEAEEAFLVTLVTQLAPIIAQAEAREMVAEQIEPGKLDDTVLLGIPSAPGVAIGQAVIVYPVADLDAVPDKDITDVISEITILQTAIAATREDILELSERLAPSLPESERELFNAYVHMLDSNSLEKDIIAYIQHGQWAQAALRQAIQTRVRQFEAMDDVYLRERGADVRDLGRRILSHLQEHTHVEIDYPPHTILIGEEISAADLARVPEGRLVGFASISGSNNSHVSILARGLGITAVTGVMNLPLSKLAHTELILDGYYGHVYVAPTETLRQEFLILAEQKRQLDESLKQLRDLPAETTDGHCIQLMVNAGLDADAGVALSVGSQGVGLFRTEMTFMTRERFPSEEEQRVIYRQILSAFAPRPVIMRTLDVGGDKPLSYFPIEEANPFLGWRGIRISLAHPELFQAQIRAMMRANRGLGNLSILLPMISSLEEFEEAKALIDEVYVELQTQEETPCPPLGIMIEVPSAVYQARALARQADFISIGSNDLTQYLLAVDRNNSRVSGIYDSFHPAVLRAIKQTVRAARLEKTPVSICGELAGDPRATLLLLAMGFDSLSASASNIPRIKWVIRRFSQARAKRLLKEVLEFETANEIREHLEATLEQAGLGGLLYAGR
jgi:phosphotransferase system enzyme I (PtsP)